MLSIIGPAKTIDTSPHGITEISSPPLNPEKAETLVDLLQQYSIPELKSLMKISDKLATLTVERLAEWNRSPARGKAIQAMLAFSGEVFNGLQARTLSEEDLLYAQDHVRILSGLYGVLKPLDEILPYRLEMGTKLKNPKGKNLYEFWEDIIPEKISRETAQQESRTLINLASNEYFKSINPGTFPHRIITPVFKESHGTGYRNVTIYAKKARGMMLRFIIQNRIQKPEYLQVFDEEGYYFNNDLSSEKEWVYCR